MRQAMLAGAVILALVAPASAFEFDYQSIRRQFNQFATKAGLAVDLHVLDCQGRANVAHCVYGDNDGFIARTDSYDGGFTTRRLNFFVSTKTKDEAVCSAIVSVLGEIASPDVPKPDRENLIFSVMPGRKDGRYPYEKSVLVRRTVYRFDLDDHGVLSASAEDLDAKQ